MQLQHYKVGEEINRGGSSVLYKGKDYESGKPVVIKVLRDNLKSESDRVKEFRHESKMLQELNEKEILELYDTGTYDGRPYMVLEYVDGRNVRSLLLNKPEYVQKYWLTIGIRSGSGLAALHMNNIVHKDVKPENILVTDTLQVRLIDLSIARKKSFFSFSFGSNKVQGTPKYMSPEQINGETVDFTSDIYSFGVLLYEMATGDPPFSAYSEQELLDMHRKKKPTPPHKVNEDMKVEVSDLIMKMLQKDPDKRPSDMNMLLYNLKKHWTPPDKQPTGTSEETLVEVQDLGSSTKLLPRSSYIYAEKRNRDEEYQKPEGDPFSVLNLSRGGVGFISDNEFRENDVLDLLLVVPSIEEEIRLRGEVQWCEAKEGNDSSEYSIGVRLLLQDPDYRKKFDRLKYVRETEFDL